MLDLNLDLEADLGIDSIKRVEILGAFQQETGIHLGEKMEQLAARRTLQEMIELLTPIADSDSDLQSLTSSLPFVQEVVALTPGEALEARCEIDLDRYPFLRHHTLGRQVSLTDPELTGLPVMPLTMSMEMLAEAAYLLVPDKVVVGMRDVRASRWIALEDDRLILKVTATRKPSPSSHEIHVQVCAADGQTAPTTPIIEGTVIFDETYPDPPVVPTFELRGGRPSRWMPERLYEEGMFHGPAFRGVLSMDRWGKNGAEATLEVLPLEGLFAPQADRTLLTDPVLLDQPGQVVAFWMAEHLERGYVIFPFRLEALHLYGPLLSPREEVKCQARIELVGDWQVRSDLDVVRGDGRLWARFVGWEDRRFDLPRSFFRYLLKPRDTVLSSPWPLPVAQLPEPSAFQCCRLDLDEFPEEFFKAHGGIWRRVLAHVVLNRQEREVWRNLRKPENRRTEWLLGRVVAKDTVRLYLRDRYGMELCPADIEIVADEHGQPRVQGRWMEKLEDGLVLSLTHSGGVVVAVVGGGDGSAGVGVDVEHVGRINEDVERVAFTPEEQELLSSVRDISENDWPLRLWCAKEAVAKALGQGMIGGPEALVVKALDVSTGSVKVSLAGEMARRCPESNNTLTVYTAREGDLIVATALCERT
jgi:phosphopantetheine--protein transferase-like protein